MKLKISEKFKKLIVDTGRELYKQNLTIGTWGNISRKYRGQVLQYNKDSKRNSFQK